MRFTPLNIKQQEFSKALRGYNAEEVRVFLERLANEYEKLLEENEKLRKENEKLSEEINAYKKIEKNLQDTLLTTKESSTKTLESAKKQAALRLKEAELKAKQIIDKAEKNAEFIRESVSKLKEEKALLLAKLKAMIETQEKILGLVFSEKEINRKEEKPEKTKEEKDIDADDILEKLL
jgi:cell division initiation protein